MQREPDAFDQNPEFRSRSKEEAIEVLKNAEEAGLVHLTSHVAAEEISQPPKDEMSWFDERANERGVDMSQYK